MSQKGTKQSNYVPSKTELKLLEVLLDPASRMLSVVDICKKAKIAKDTYYKAFAREEFSKLYREESLGLLRRAVAPMINALTREACRGNAPHLKMGLEIADIYTESVNVITESYPDRIKRLRGDSKS